MVTLEKTGREFLRLMGLSGQVPGALAAEDLPRALTALRAGLATASAQAPERDAHGEDDNDNDVTTTLARRAGPLLDMLEGAEQSGEHLIWDHQ